MNNIAFVTIATGPFSRTCKAEACLESLYRIAKYTGSSFLITDSPGCHDINNIRKNAGSDNIELITVGNFSRKIDSPIGFLRQSVLGVPVWVPRFISPMKRPKAKSLKAEVFNLIDDVAIDILIYIDADAIFLREEGLDDLLHFASSDWQSEGVKFRVNRFPDEQHPERKLNIHTGFMIAHRTLSRKALQHWSQMMAIKQHWVRNFSDKEKYLRAYEQVREEKGNPEYMTVFPIPNHRYEVILDPANDRGLIGHITSGRIKHHGKMKIEEYLSKLGLKSYPARYYTLPGMPQWMINVFYFGYFGYYRNYKIEKVWKGIRSKFNG
ncbi:MAG: hypothetical protein RIE59_11735 [Imperialibacter sp.]